MAISVQKNKFQAGMEAQFDMEDSRASNQIVPFDRTQYDALYCMREQEGSDGGRSNYYRGTMFSGPDVDESLATIADDVIKG